MSSRSAELAAIALLPLLALLLLYISPREKRVVAALMGTFAVKTVLALANTFIVQFYSYNGDWATLNQVAQAFARDAGGVFDTLSQAKGRYFFSWLVSIQYRLIGETPFFVIAVNIFLTSVVALLAYKTIEVVYGRNKFSWYVLLLCLGFPIYFLGAIDPSREPLVTSAFMVFIFFFTKWTLQRKGAHLLVAIGGLTLASSIHSGFAILLMALLSYLMLTANRRFFLQRGRSAATWILTSILGLSILSFVIVTGWGLNKFGGDVSNLTTIETIEAGSYGGDNENRTGYIASSDLAITSFSQLLSQIPYRTFLFLFKPFPWNMSAVADMVAFAMVLIYGGTIFLVIKYRKFYWHQYHLRMYLYICAILIPLFALGTLSWGTAVRHKAKFMPVVIILASAYFINRRQIKARRMYSVSMQVISSEI